MRKSIPMLAAVAVFALSGCASTSNEFVRKERNEVDTAKIAAVNAWSIDRGVKTTWVNPPVKRVPYERPDRND